MLELINVTRNFGGLRALDHVNLAANEGKIVGLIGPNGAGKTTLINQVSGIDQPSSGEIIFKNKPIHKLSAYQISRLGIARTYQNIRLFSEMTALENLLIGHHANGKATAIESIFYAPRYLKEERTLHDEAMALLARFNLADMARMEAGNLPYGDQRRLELARALATHPQLLLLDEPTAGMNPIETEALGEQIIRLAHDEGLTVLIIEHDMSLIHQVCDEIYVLNFGKVIAHGTPDEIRNDPAVVEAYLGVEAFIGEGGDHLAVDD